MRAKEEAPRTRSRPAIAEQDGASASLPARPFRVIANNAAERALRMMQLRMKTSGRFRTLPWAEDFAIMHAVDHRRGAQ